MKINEFLKELNESSNEKYNLNSIFSAWENKDLNKVKKIVASGQLSKNQYSLVALQIRSQFKTPQEKNNDKIYNYLMQQK
jgi:hypothetical protein